MCSETSEAVGTTWEHAQLEFQKFLKIRNKNPPTDRGSRGREPEGDDSGGKGGGLGTPGWLPSLP